MMVNPTEKQKAFLRRLLVELGYVHPALGTFYSNAKLLPHNPTMRERSGKVDAWLDRLTVSQASEVIDYLLAQRQRQAENPRRRRSNPSEAAPVREIYEEFHGRPPRKVEEIETEIIEPGWLAALGDLVEITVNAPAGRMQILFDRDPPLLCTDASGEQLYIEGGDQSVDLVKLGVTPKPLAIIGEIEQITYRTEKSFDGFETIDYYHQLGEESGIRPVLVYDSVNKILRVAGGNYRIRPEGIVD